MSFWCAIHACNVVPKKAKRLKAAVSKSHGPKPYVVIREDSPDYPKIKPFLRAVPHPKKRSHDEDDGSDATPDNDLSTSSGSRDKDVIRLIPAHTAKECRICRNCYMSLRQLFLHPDEPLRLVSRIPNAGKGLFANRDYKKGEFIDYYGGLLIDRSSLDVNLNNSHTLALTKNLLIDGSNHFTETIPGRSIKGLGQFCNNRGGHHNNAKIVIRTVPSPSAVVIATKNIPFGEEICVSYGGSYRLGSHPRSNLKNVLNARYRAKHFQDLEAAKQGKVTVQRSPRK